ncbi:hypothetical protein EDB86DRAFT_3076745 [Lactarius hatsudake]|nr:hypothetical protein EDB86DRAFT_3076745 [Lactarius hatsudake]
MRSHDPTLPSISFVLSQAHPAAPRGGRRWNRFGIRRSKSTPSFAPHPPRYPPRLDSDFLTVNIWLYETRSYPVPLFHALLPPPPLNFYFALIGHVADPREKTVDYRYSSPPRAPSRSSFALPKDIFDADAEIEIVMPSPTESEPSTDSATGIAVVITVIPLAPARVSVAVTAVAPGAPAAVTAFFHVSFSAPRITKLVSRLVLNCWGGVSPSRF